MKTVHCAISRRYCATNPTKPVVYVQRNIPYASHHPCNVMDIYESSTECPASLSYSSSPLKRRTKFLFVHGGMWMFGSKDHEIHTSLTGLLQGLFSRTFQQTDPRDTLRSNTLFRRAEFSNVGVAVARHGGQAFIINYRLLVDSLIQSSSQQRSAYPDQAMDVARAISFLVHQDWEERQRIIPDDAKPNIFVAGFSAGAHLAALALANSSYMSRAMAERGMDSEKINLQEYIAGFIGISGPYNVRRLHQSPFSDLTIGPSFFGKGLPKNPKDQNGYQVHNMHKPSIDAILAEASPIHVVLSSHEARNECTSTPLLCKIPLLMINAENDFHLSQDSKELLVALGQYSTSGKAVDRFHSIIPATNHFNLMKEFDMYESDVADHPDTKNEIHPGYFKWVLDSLGLQTVDPSLKLPVSTTTQHVVEFMQRVQNSTMS